MSEPQTELNIDWSRFPNFSAGELACRCGCSGFAFHPGFLEELQTLRDLFGLAMIVTSGARCARHNQAEGGHPKSLHIFDKPFHGALGTLAVDVAASGAKRGELFSCAWELGWSIGWGGARGFLHLDRRDFVGLHVNTFDY